MTIYSCKPQWEDMLTCIYVAWASGKGHENIRLCIEPIEQYTLFDQYIHVDADMDKARAVTQSVCQKISPYVYRELAYTAMAYEEDVLDNIYRVMILGFAFGPAVLEMMQYRDVMRHRQIRKRVASEAHHFIEFIRFHEIKSMNGASGSVYIAHIEPKSRIVTALGDQFSDRLPSEYWMIVDDIHREAIVHPKDEPFYLIKLTDEEFDRLLLTEQVNDEFTSMWKSFFDVIAIEQRINSKCQDNLFPKWTRKHAVEFM